MAGCPDSQNKVSHSRTFPPSKVTTYATLEGKVEGWTLKTSAMGLEGAAGAGLPESGQKEAAKDH